MTEAILVMPLFFAVAFALLQMGQLGVGFLMTNYAASSIARKAANEQAFATVTLLGSVPTDPLYESKAGSLMVAGMEYAGLKECVSKDASGTPTGELSVYVRAKLRAWPFFGDIVHGGVGDRMDPVVINCAEIASGNAVSPINFSADAPYYFYVTGKARVRLNYM